MRANRRWDWLGFLLILGVTLAAYAPALRGALLWNDSDYVTAPRLRSLHGLWRIWFDVGAVQQYYPLLHSAFWVEHRLWGDATLGYHLVNIALHATSACLFVVILRKLWAPPSPWAPWLAGFLFALHPVAVESVAWITEQKNTLSTVFYLLATIVYLRFDGIHRGGSREAFVAGPRTGNETLTRSATYFLATFLFLLALLSKSVTATLPAALLVVLWWKRGSLSRRRDVIPLLPWFALALAAGLFTGYVEKHYVGADGPSFRLPPVERLLVAGRVIWFYLGKTLWPGRLIFIYPRWAVNAGEWRQYLCPLAAAAGLLWLWTRARSGRRSSLAAGLLFAGALAPLLGFFNVYAFIFSFVADHWQYLALFPAIAAAAALWSLLFRHRPRLASALAVIVLAAMAAADRAECRHYGDQETFYRTILARNPNSAMAHNNLGILCYNSGRWPEAMTHYQEALRLKPDFPDALNNHALLLINQDHAKAAIPELVEALRLGPDSAATRHNLGIALVRLGHLPEAIAQFQRSLRLDPDSAQVRYRLASALADAGRTAQAQAEYRELIRRHPDHAEAHNNLGSLLGNQGRLVEAAAEFAQAVRLKPDYAEARRNLAAARLALHLPFLP